MNTYRTLPPEKRLFYKSLLSLVIPITIQNLITNMVNSADVLMLNYVGQSSMSAVSLANQYHFILGGFFFGIASGTTMLCAQYWGKKDMDSSHQPPVQLVVWCEPSKGLFLLLAQKGDVASIFTGPL